MLPDEVNEADPEDPLRESLQSRPSREGGFRNRKGYELQKKRIVKARNVIPRDYSMYEPQVQKKPSFHDLNSSCFTKKPPIAAINIKQSFGGNSISHRQDQSITGGFNFSMNST